MVKTPFVAYISRAPEHLRIFCYDDSDSSSSSTTAGSGSSSSSSCGYYFINYDVEGTFPVSLPKKELIKVFNNDAKNLYKYIINTGDVIKYIETENLPLLKAEVKLRKIS